MQVSQKRCITPDVVSIQPEVQLLIACARLRRSVAIDQIIRELATRSINWQQFLDLARNHGVSVLVYHSLKAVCPHAAPQAVWTQLKNTASVFALRNMALTQELLRVLALLQAQGIRAIAFKGPVLAAEIYGDIGLRQFCDLDLLVSETDFRAAIAALLQANYETADIGWHFLTAAQEAAYVRSVAESSLKNGIVGVDLHHHLVPQHFLGRQSSVADLLDRQTMVSLNGQSVSGLGREDLLLYLCLHGAKEGWKTLKWICDVAEVVDAGAIDWDQLFDRAATQGAQRILLLGLSLAARVRGVELPFAVHREMTCDRSVRRLAERSIDRLFEQFNPLHDPEVDSLSDVLFLFHALETPRDRLQHSWWHLKRFFVPNTEDRKQYPLPEKLNGLYYLIRPFRLLSERLKRSNNSTNAERCISDAQ